MIDLGDDPQWLLTSQKKRQDITYLLIEVHNANSKTLFIKLKQLREKEQRDRESEADSAPSKYKPTEITTRVAA